MPNRAARALTLEIAVSRVVRPAAAAPEVAIPRLPIPIAEAPASTPETVIVQSRSTAQKEVRVTVTNHARGAAKADVTLDLPQGWRAVPATQPASFSREDESITVKFALQPPAASVLAAAAMKPGGNQFAVKAVVRGAGQESSQGYQVIEYPHIQRRHKIVPAETTVKVVDVAVAPGLKVGYIMGVGDLVRQALDQLGIKPAMIDSDELAYGNLARYDTIVLGIRAYEHRYDLRRYNDRMMKYVQDGTKLAPIFRHF